MHDFRPSCISMYEIHESTAQNLSIWPTRLADTH